MELTKEHFEQAIKGLATKKDLKTLATKADLKGLASKKDLDDLKRFIQNHLVTKAELKEALATLPNKKQIDKLTTAFVLLYPYH